MEATGTANPKHPQPVRYDRALALALRQLRGSVGALQDEIATRARLHGLQWDRRTVNALETGKRRLLDEERALLPILYGRPVTPQDLFPEADGWIALSDQYEITGRGLWALWAGRTPEAKDQKLRVPTSRKTTDLATAVEDRRMLRRLLKGYDEIPGHVVADFQADAEIKAAARFDVSPQVVAAAAFTLWGRSLTGERERRVTAKAAPDMTPRSVQAIRGHITRELFDELELTIRRAKQGGNR